MYVFGSSLTINFKRISKMKMREIIFLSNLGSKSVGHNFVGQTISTSIPQAVGHVEKEYGRILDQQFPFNHYWHARNFGSHKMIKIIKLNIKFIFQINPNLFYHFSFFYILFGIKKLSMNCRD